MQITSQYRQLSYPDYAKLMQLLPRLRLQLEREGDKSGVEGVIIAIQRTGKKAKEYIDAQAKGSDTEPSEFAKGILEKKINNQSLT